MTHFSSVFINKLHFPESFLYNSLYRQVFVCFVVRDLLQGDISQEEDVSDVHRHYYCPELPRTTTTTSACSPQTSAPLPVRSLLQVEQVRGNGTQTEPMDTGSCDIISLTPVRGGATNTSGSCPGLPVRSFRKTRDDCSLPSSPHSGWRLPCSLPCSPLLGGRRWRSSPSSPSPPLGLSRLWVEAALQRSKQTEPCPPPPCSPQVRQEGEKEVARSRGGEREGDDDEEEEDKQVVGIRVSDTAIIRPMTSPSVCGRKGEEEDSDVSCLDSETWRYCLLTPCVCFRYENLFIQVISCKGPSSSCAAVSSVSRVSIFFASCSYMRTHIIPPVNR